MDTPFVETLLVLAKKTAVSEFWLTLARILAEF